MYKAVHWFSGSSSSLGQISLTISTSPGGRILETSSSGTSKRFASSLDMRPVFFPGLITRYLSDFSKHDTGPHMTFLAF